MGSTAKHLMASGVDTVSAYIFFAAFVLLRVRFRFTDLVYIAAVFALLSDMPWSQSVVRRPLPARGGGGGVTARRRCTIRASTRGSRTASWS